MPDALDGIIQRMYDAGESEDDIAAVIKDYKKNPPRPVQESIAEPDTFFGGVSKSLFSGEALKAGLEGALGFGKGALLNLPSTIATGVGDALEVATSPIRTARNAPEAFRAIPDVARGMWDTATRAGSDPFAFGEMIGELTGQPLATAGIAKGAPYMRAPAGKTLAATGRVLKRHQPLTGVLPRMVEPRIARTVERAAGAGIERLGNAIAGNNKKPPPSPPPGGNLNKSKVPPVEDQMAGIIQELRNESAKAPNVEAPPPPYSLGAGSPPEQPRVSVRAPKSPTPKKGKEPSLGKVKEDLDKWEPSIDPKAKTEAQIFAETVAQTDRSKLLSALEEMAARDANPNIDFSTGEILDLEAPIQAPYTGPRTGPSSPYGSLEDFTRQVSESDAFVPRPTGTSELSVTNQPRRTFFSRLSDETGAVGADIGPIIERNRARNPLRPTVPEGQVTNRRMFDLSAERGAENSLAQESRSFANQIIPNEFAEDMLFTPDELRTPDIPEMISPVENPFDPRTAPGGVVSDITPVATEKTPTFIDRLKQFIADETGELDLGESPKGKSVGDRRWSIAHPSGKPIGDIEVSRAEIAAARKAGKVPDGMSDVDYSNALFQEKLNKLALDNGYGPNDQSRLRMQYHTKAAKEGSVEVKPKSPTVKSKPVGPKGKSWKVAGPKGEDYGTIDVTPEEVAAYMDAEGGILKDANPDDISKSIYEQKLEDLMIDNGFDPDRMGELNIEQVRAGSGKKKEGTLVKKPEPEVPKMEEHIPTGRDVLHDSIRVEQPEKPAISQKPRGKASHKEKDPLDPEAAFGYGGDVHPIAREAARMDRLQSPDTSFKKLLPKNMQYALEPGESFKKRLQTLVNGIIEAEDPANKRMNEALLKERDEFLKSVRQGHENMQPPLRAHDQELLKANEVRWSPRYRKLIKK